MTGKPMAIVVLLLTLGAGVAAAADDATDTQVLLKSYYSHAIIREVQAGAQAMIKGRDGGIATQVVEAASQWAAGRKQAVRAELAARFGNDAKPCFAFFVGRYTEAEDKGDAQYLATLNNELRIAPPPRSYADLRRALTERWFKADIAAIGKKMGDIQTWVDLAAAGRKVPTLAQWLDRDRPPARAANSLAAAEAPLPDFKKDDGKQTASPLDAFGSGREARNERTMAEAQAGMKQVAEERRAAEEEEGKRQAADAQREAEGVKAYAQKLADAEKEAMEQRQNTWSARLKRLAVSVVTGSASAVTAGVGSAAGAAIAEQMFD